jgi:hypothetical protein
MATPRTPRRRPDAPSAPTTLTEIARRYYATAIALAMAMGVPMSETFLREHRESISCCFIEAGRAGVRLPPAVQLPPIAQANGQPDVSNTRTGNTNTGEPEAGEIMCSGRPPAPEAPSTNGHGTTLTSLAPEIPNAVVPENGTIVPIPLTTVPTDAGLPCGGQTIATLKPAQLAMLISKTARLVQDEGGRWVPLLHALQSERAARLDRGRKTSGEG